MRSSRILRRRTMKEELDELKEMVKNSKPLIAADQQLRRAYFAGYKKRLQEEMEERNYGVPTVDPNAPAPHVTDEVIDQGIQEQAATEAVVESGIATL